MGAEGGLATGWAGGRALVAAVPVKGLLLEGGVGMTSNSGSARAEGSGVALSPGAAAGKRAAGMRKHSNAIANAQQPHLHAPRSENSLGFGNPFRLMKIVKEQ